MKTNRFKAALASLAAASLALVGACSSGGSEGGSSAAPESSDDASSSQESETTESSDYPDLKGKTLNVVAAWSGDEQKNFEKVLAKFQELTGAEVKYESFGDNGPTFIQTRLEGGNPPDVAVIAQPALLQSLAKDGNIKPLAEDVQAVVRENYSESWIDLGSVEDKNYGVWFKAANKSTMWYNTTIWDEAGADPEKAAEDWDAFVEQLGLIRDAGYAGISVGADKGWPLTDWFENVYLRVAGPEKYDQLTKHEIPWTDDSVKETLEILGKLWGSDVVQPGGGQRDFPTSVTETFGADPKAGTVYEGDFVAGNIAADGNSTVGDTAKFFDFPSVKGSAPAVMGAGDVAVQFTDEEASNAFMKFLASPESAAEWIPNGGLTSPNKAVDTSLYPDETSKQIAEALVNAEDFRFDMSDLTPSAFGGTEGQGFWQELITFYEKPSDVEGAMKRLEAAAVSAYK